MDFDFIFSRLSVLAQLPNKPEAHVLAMPPERQRWIEQARTRKTPARQASVLCCLYPNEIGAACFALIRRQESPHTHGGQYALPGGKREANDVSNWATALREAEEEVQIPKEQVQFVRSLHSIYIPPSHFDVHPFLGLLKKTPRLQPQWSEVAAIHTIPVATLLEPTNLRQISMTTSYMKDQLVPAFDLAGHMVWGATAMMLAELRELLNALAK